MIAVKDNKVYTVNELNKKAYLAQGFDICEDDGTVIERPAGATVKYEEYKAVVDENLKLKAELEMLKTEKKK